MPMFEDRTASFIVRVWCEIGDARARSVPAWRGSIEHVPSGQRAFFQELEAVTTFMKPHLVALGITEPDRFWERMDEAAAPTPAAPSPGLPAPRPPRRRR